MPEENQMKDVDIEPGTVPTQDWATGDDKGLVERMNEIFGDDAENAPEPEKAKEEQEKKEKPVDGSPATQEGSEEEDGSKDEEIIEEALSAEDDAKTDDDETVPEPEALDEEEFDKETEELAKGMAKKAGARFKELRAELKEAKKKLILAESDERIPESVKKKLEEAELKARRAAELEEQFDELRNTSAKVRLESSDEYKKQVVQPVAGIIKRIDGIAEANDIDPAVLQGIVREQDIKRQNAMIAEHLDGMSERDKVAVYSLSERFAEIVEKRNEMMEDANSAIEKMEAERLKKEEAKLEERRGIYKTLQKNLWEKYLDRIPGLADEDGAPTDVYDKLRSKGMNYDFSKAGEKDMAYAAFAGVLLPHVVKELAKLRKELETVDGKARKTKRSAPSMADGEVQEDNEPSDNEGFLERMSKASF